MSERKWTPDEMRRMAKGADWIGPDIRAMLRQGADLYEVNAALHAALEKHGNWDDGCFYYNGKSASELQEPLAKARAALQRAEGEG